MHGYMYVCRCVGVYGRRSERRSFFRGISPQDLLAALLSLYIHPSRYIDGYLDTSMHIWVGVCMGMAMRTLLCHGCTRTAPLAAVDAPTHGPLAPPERIRGMPFATSAACYGIHGCIHGMMAHRRPVQTWMACQSIVDACGMCANRWHTVCTCAHYAGSSDPSHCPHAPGARELASAHGWAGACMCA